MPAKRDSYHHGALRGALIEAAQEMIREDGPEVFSLREAARRAGVSPGAPSHHFGNVAGLLTEVAANGYDELGRYLDRVSGSATPVHAIHAYTTAYVDFALDHPERFRLMCRKRMIDRTASRFTRASTDAVLPFANAAAAYYGTKLPSEPGEPLHPGVLSVIATAHGIAHMAIEDKFAFALRMEDGRTDFLTRLLPEMLTALWPIATDRIPVNRRE